MENTFTNLTIAFILLSIIIIISLWLLIKTATSSFSSSSSIPVNWPVVGMLPGVILNHQRFTEWCSEILVSIPTSTFHIKGPWLSSMDILITSNPVNIQHIFCKHHFDFHKGPHFNDIFDYLGDGIFNADDELWKYQRKIALSSFSNPRLRRFMASSSREKLEQGLVPLLERWWSQGDVIDLQDVLGRMMSDISSIMLTGHDPKSLRPDLPSHFFCDAAHHGEEVILMRHLLPESVWKLQRWLGVGKEGTLKKVIYKVDEFFYDFIAKKKEEVKRRKEERNDVGGPDPESDLFTLYIEEGYGRTEHGFKSNDRFLRDTFVTFMLAGQDTVSSGLSWFFWLLSKYPRVKDKIKEEMAAQKVSFTGDDDNVTSLLFQGGVEDGVSSKLVYLHAAIYEALRLYPPVPHNHRAACGEETTLPTGHMVGPNTMILTCLHAMGRMEGLWGKDCLEYKPERWITEQGTIRYEPAHKFLVFNAGPRICLGKDISLVQMKAVILCVLSQNYRFEVVQGHLIEPKFSVVFHMKYGLKVRVMKD